MADDPIIVNSSAAPAVTMESIKATVLGAVIFGVDHFVRYESTSVALAPIAAVVAGMITAFGMGVWTRLRTNKKLIALANSVSDEIAKVI